ncbi:exocyst complex component EXO70, partial [Klebsiella pneumoniae]|uniref:exocyst complex component EXO70 n=1 Tax=Klebsiella pneumoniae TaxID=573 RepID=UPI003013203A
MEEELENPSDDLDRPSSSLSVQIAWILEVLNGNLESKSKIYDIMPLSLIFLINNGRYIVNKVKDSELAALMGEDWIRRQMARIKRWCGN